MQRKSIVLPAPEGPRIPSGPLPLVNDTSSVKSVSFLEMSISRAILVPHPSCAALCEGPIIQGTKERKRNHQINRAPCHCCSQIVRLNSKVNGNGDCGRPSRNIARDHQGGAEFSDCAGERQYCPCENAWPSKWQCNLAEHSPFSGPECACRFQIAMIHLLQRGARRQIHQRERNHCRRDYGCRP